MLVLGFINDRFLTSSHPTDANAMSHGYLAFSGWTMSFNYARTWFCFDCPNKIMFAVQLMRINVC